MNLSKFKKDFPIFQTNPKLVYLDNAATTQKPAAVISAIAEHYAYRNANIHRGIYKLSEEATRRYEEARTKVARFISAPNARNIAFTRNATEAINLVAHGFLKPRLKASDEILLTTMEHHANIVPWHMIAKDKKAKLKFANITKDGQLDEADLKRKITAKTKLLAFAHASNVLGTINDVKKIIKLAHAKNIPVLIDGAQAVPHFPVDVSEIGCDFYAFSGHKLLAPTGIGALYISEERLAETGPFLGGGDMVKYVSEKDVLFQDAPARFEAGTPAIEAAIALGAAIDYLEKIGMKNIEKHERELSEFALKEFRKIPGIAIYGPVDPKKRTGLVSFNLARAHPHDLASLLDEENIALRAGHHCAQPLHQALGISATLRMSFYIYNTKDDIKKACAALKRISIGVPTSA